MKYQVGVIYNWEGEFSVEADDEEEAREIVRDELFSDPWVDACGGCRFKITEVYEWDDAAQKKCEKEIEKELNDFVNKVENHPNVSGRKK